MIHSPFRVQAYVASLWCALLCLSATCVTCLQASTDGLHAPFAVVRPFWENDLAKIFDSYRDDGSPRACVNHTLPADLVLYFAGPPIDLSRLVELASRDECFDKVRVEFAHLGVDLAYPVAPCKQFVRMYEQEPPVWGYDAILMMEHDMRPLKEGWLEELVPRLREAARGDSWMTGGIYDPTCMYKISDSPRSEWPWPKKHPHTIAGNARHINGNAVYTAARPWSRLVRQHSDRCLREPAWDYWLFHRNRRSENSRKWRSDKRFLDCKSVDLNSVTMPHNRIISSNPEALFIHANPGVELNITDIPLGLFKKITDSKDSDEYPVFWHIPRAAGITVEFHVKDRFNLSQMIWHEDPARRDGGEWHIHWPKTAAVQQGRPLNLYRGEIGVVSTKSLGVLHHLLNARARGRLFTVLRHPIERFVSQFYALRARPEPHVVKNFTLARFADSEHMDEDWMTSALSDLVMHQPDLEMAKRFLRDYVVVGLSSRLGESMKRFQTFFDWPDIKKSLGARTYQLNRRVKPYPQLLSTDAAWTKLERSPRVGNLAFAKAFVAAAQRSGAEVPSWRVVHYHDPVPQGGPSHAYTHVPVEVYYGTHEFTGNSSDYTLCPWLPDAPEDTSCGAGQVHYGDIVGGLLTNDHVLYLNQTLATKDMNFHCLPENICKGKGYVHNGISVVSLLLVATWVAAASFVLGIVCERKRRGSTIVPAQPEIELSSLFKRL